MHRDEEIRREEGCCLCRAGIATKRYYLKAPKSKLIYHRDYDGDYCLCPWHDEMVKGDWYGDADVLRGAIRVYLRERRRQTGF